MSGFKVFKVICLFVVFLLVRLLNKCMCIYRVLLRVFNIVILKLIFLSVCVYV